MVHAQFDFIVHQSSKLLDAECECECIEVKTVSSANLRMTTITTESATLQQGINYSFFVLFYLINI